jgi:hypothetical protein
LAHAKGSLTGEGREIGKRKKRHEGNKGHKGNGQKAEVLTASAKPSITCVIEQGWSKLSRYVICKFRPGYVKKNLAHRGGECRRCALCCKVFFQCPFLSGDTCKIYGKRFTQCRAFPIDERDVNLITKMGGKCGFVFPEDRA